jgi:hypothetical protein
LRNAARTESKSSVDADCHERRRLPAPIPMDTTTMKRSTLAMLLKLLLELLYLTPALTDDVEKVIQEFHSTDPTGQKVAVIAQTAAAIADTAAQVIAPTPAAANDNKGGS